MCLDEQDQEYWANIYLNLRSIREVDAREITKEIIKKSVKGNSL